MQHCYSVIIIMSKMKKLFFVFAVLIGISACSTDLTDIENRIKEVEEQGKNLDNQQKKLEEEKNRLQQESNQLAEEAKKRQEENEKIRKRLTEFEDSLNSIAKLLTLEFVAADNPLQLIENVRGTIIGDSVVECRISNVTTNKVLVPRFTFQGSVVTINGLEAESGVTAFDFSKPVVLSVITPYTVKDYTVYVGAYTGLPTVWLETSNHEDVTLANTNYRGRLKVAGGTSTSENGYLSQLNVNFMALSDSWYTSRIHDTPQWGKNEYALTLNTESSLLDAPLGKEWNLYTNKGDRTMLHTMTAFELGEMSALEYTPRFHHVNFMLNGRYYGTYLIGEALEVSEGRVNVGSKGYLLGVGTNIAGVSFNTSYLDKPVTIIGPNSSKTFEGVSYITNYLLSAENALFSSDFANASSGWQKYMDMDSFVDWYIINEIAKNDNGTFKADCIMNLTRGGKLKMGPLWGFERAFNTNSSANGFVVKNGRWFARLFQDPAFVSKVKERYNFFYTHKKDIINGISANAAYLKYAIQEDNNKWETFTSTRNSSDKCWELYQGTVMSMEKWISTRMDWLKGEYDAMS